MDPWLSDLGRLVTVVFTAVGEGAWLEVAARAAGVNMKRLSMLQSPGVAGSAEAAERLRGEEASSCSSGGSRENLSVFISQHAG